MHTPLLYAGLAEDALLHFDHSLIGTRIEARYLHPQTKELLMWGKVKKYSWLQDVMPCEDDAEKYPTLCHYNDRPKLMREAVAASLHAAPVRS